MFAEVETLRDFYSSYKKFFSGLAVANFIEVEVEAHRHLQPTRC